jgi:hypothetical protein
MTNGIDLNFKTASKNPALVPDKDLKYAQVIKNRKGKRLQKVEKRVPLQKI